MGIKNLSKRRSNVSKRRSNVSKRRSNVSKRRNKVTKRRSKVYNRQSRLFKYGGVDPSKSRTAPPYDHLTLMRSVKEHRDARLAAKQQEQEALREMVAYEAELAAVQKELSAAEARTAVQKELSAAEARTAVQNKNYLIYFDDKLDYFTKGSMNFERGDWYGLYSIEQNGIYRKIIDENNEIIGIPVCCNQEKSYGLEHPYYIHGSNWKPYETTSTNILWDEGYFHSEKSSIPKEMFETLLEACKKCKQAEPNSTINLAFDWDQNLSKFEQTAQTHQ